MNTSKYKCKYYQEETRTVSEDNEIISCNSKSKMNINERSFVKLYTDSLCITNDIKYKDLIFLYALGKHMDELNIVHLDIPTRKKIQSSLGDIHKSAISNTLKKLVNLGLLYKVLDDEDYKVLRSVYMINPKMIGKNNAGVMRKLEWYVEINLDHIRQHNTVVFPKLIDNTLSLNISKIPTELRK